MSNVLIGIIGVILFIGLALAGALFLGPRFQQSVAQSKASAVAQQITQVAHAISLRGLTTGTLQPSQDETVTAAVADGYLKAAPTNPFVSEQIFRVGDDLGSPNNNQARYVFTNIGLSEAAKAACVSIEKNAGVADPSDHIDTIVKFDEWVPTHRRLGCINNFYQGSYSVYAPI